jgi:hypothetical protein
VTKSSNPDIGWPASLPDPQHVGIRASVLLRLAKQGLEDMGDPNLDFARIMLGFFGVVVFGRSVTLALQHLRTFDEQAFDAWYAPWQAEMKDDPVFVFFNKLRTDILHDVDPIIGVVIGSGSGRYNPVDDYIDTGEIMPKGTVSLGPDYPRPTSHRGKPIKSADMRHLATVYLGYLDELMTAVSPFIASIQARWRAEHPWQTPQNC